jgi:hypothetical protein
MLAFEVSVLKRDTKQLGKLFGIEIAEKLQEKILY